MRVSLQPEFGLPKDVLIHTDQSNRNFSEHLKNVKNNHIKHRMDLELNAINDIGRRLLKNMSLSDLREYRKKIAEFLKMCISQGFISKKSNFQPAMDAVKYFQLSKPSIKNLLTWRNNCFLKTGFIEDNGIGG